MMKKRLLGLLLAALMLLGMLPAALAEEPQHTPFTPGALTQTRFAEAFEKGDAVCAIMGMSLSMNAETLGLTDEEADAMNVVLDAFRSAQLSVAAVKVEGGVMLELSGAYFKDENTYASLDAQLEITKTGLALTSDTLIPGERVTVTWETVLAMLGVDEETAQQVLALRDMTKDEILSALSELADEFVNSLAEEVLPVALPYLQVFSDYVNGLPVTVEENVPADGIFPAAAMEVTSTVTEKAVGECIVALCDVLEADTTLAPMLDAYLANMSIEEGIEPALTTADLCAALREEAAAMTDEAYPMTSTVGVDAEGNLLYISMNQTEADGSVVALNWINTAAAPEETAFHLEFFVADAQQVHTGFTCDVQYTGDADDPNVADVHVSAALEADGESLLSLAFDLTLEPAITEDGMSAYTGSYTCDFKIDDPVQAIAMSIIGAADTALTPEGGEITYSSYTMNAQVGSTVMQQTVEESMELLEDEDGPLVEYIEVMTMPESGIDELYVYAQVFTVPYAPDGTLTELALEHATSEDMDALMGRVAANAQAQLETLIELLPEELLALMEPAEEPATASEAQ